MRFKEFLNEEILDMWSKDELITAKEIMDIIKSNNLYKESVIYRGMNTSKNFAEVTNDRTSFYGALSQNTVNIVKNHIKIKNPTFATFDMNQAHFFGAVHIFIPQSKDTLYVNPKIRDIMGETIDGYDNQEDQEKIAKVYISYNIKTVNKSKGKAEILVDTKRYYMVDYLLFVKSFKTKFFTPKTSIEKLTYGDVYDAINAYVGLEEWKQKQGHSKTFDQRKDDLDKTIKRTNDLRQDRRSPQQKSVRFELLKNLLRDNGIEYISASENEDFQIEFKTQKAAKEAFKIVSKEMNSGQNQRKLMNLKQVEFISADLQKKFIVGR